MALHEIEIFAIVAAMFALFFSERLRYDMIGAMALLAAVTTGCLPGDKAFLGFSNPVIIIIASVLVLSRAIEGSGVLDAAMRHVLRRLHSPDAQIGVLVAGVTLLSAFMKNIGALALFLPIAVNSARLSQRSASIYLMPLAFGSLIGGTITLIGTSPNLVIASFRKDLGGQAFRMFDFTPVGAPLAILAVLYLTWGWRLLPKARAGSAARAAPPAFHAYTTELHIGEASSIVGKTIAEVENAAEGDIDVIAIIREGGARFIPRSSRRFRPGDILTVSAESSNLKKFVDANGLELAGSVQASGGDDLVAIEAVVLQNSNLVGMSARRLGLRARFNVSLVAVSRAGTQVRSRLRSHVLAPGDLVLLQGYGDDMPARLKQLGCLPLADSSLKSAGVGGRYVPLFALAAAVGLILFNVIPPELAFFAAAIAMVLCKQVTPKEAYEAIDWPIIVMLGSLIPVGEAFRDVGAAQTIARLLTHAVAPLPGFAALGIVLLTTMLVAPLMHHAAAAIMMGPIAAAIAASLNLNTDAFLMAVALGASCDFLTPIGHQNNILVMGPGGYRFGDYWRLGLPLSLLTLVLGTALIVRIWPLT